MKRTAITGPVFMAALLFAAAAPAEDAHKVGIT
jgi:hypothetical protein